MMTKVWGGGWFAGEVRLLPAIAIWHCTEACRNAAEMPFGRTGSTNVQ